MLTERTKIRLSKDRPTTSITLRIPVDVVESMKTLAPLVGFSGYQTLLKSYISAGLRKDEERLAGSSTARLIEALKRRGVSDEVLTEASREAA
jgi:hypothetical protein